MTRSASSARKKPAAAKKTAAAKGTSKTSKSSAAKTGKAPGAKKTSTRSAATKKAAAAPRKKTPAKKTPARRPRGAALSGPDPSFGTYSERDGEEYMSAEQLEHFRAKLLAWKHDLLEEADRTMGHLKDEHANYPDPNDRATQESEFALELRTRDRERKLLRKIESALQRIEDGTYGYCEETGEEIGLKRLEVRPVATLCIEAQERRERAERVYADDR